MFEQVGWPFGRAEEEPERISKTPESVRVEYRDRDAPYPTFTLAVVGLLTAGLLAKAVSASKQARISQHEADSWRQVALRLVDRGEGKLTYSEIDQIRRNKWVKRGCPPAPSPIVTPVTAIDNSPHSRHRERHAPAHVHADRQEMKYEPRRVASPPVKAASRPSYAPIHPHEDWDWTPADWPVSRTSWRRSRLPPWAIGFSSAARARSSSPFSAEPDKKPNHGLEAAIAAHQTGESVEELLFQSAVWPDAQPAEPNVCAGESAFIADEVINEIFEQQTKQKQSSNAGLPKYSSKPKTVSECQRKKVAATAKENEKAWVNFNSIAATDRAHSRDDDAALRTQALERQVWALLRRLEDLERFGQTGRRF